MTTDELIAVSVIAYLTIGFILQKKAARDVYRPIILFAWPFTMLFDKVKFWLYLNTPLK